ncbi:type I-B CRISPR-associated protein Cas7/Csh2 [Clostridium oryzae]|nr:type I-B CRISPR-associated protein Cas7/Csh2 [Clostridium oryzae]
MKNSEILYIYDAKLSNPNGDPDEENRPRMDYEREINLVSDLRLKRYVRDYLMDKGYSLFVQGIDDKPVTAEQRIKALESNDTDTILDKLIDVRMFGATIPFKGDNKNFTGPIQFNWGYSLNKVELLETSITSHFTSKEGNNQGSIGKDYRVKYSFIAFSGVISGKRAEKVKLSEEDVNLLDKAMRYAIPEQCTRSKIGQHPRLYMRVQYKDDETILGDMRDYIKFQQEEESIRDIKECALDVTELRNFLVKNAERIEAMYYFYDDKLELQVNGEKATFNEAFGDFTLVEVK